MNSTDSTSTRIVPTRSATKLKNSGGPASSAVMPPDVILSGPIASESAQDEKA